MVEIETVVGKGHGRRWIETERAERAKDEVIYRVIRTRKEKTKNKWRTPRSSIREENERRMV